MHKSPPIAAPERAALVIIVGPTASGKSALAIALARRFGGEVISADSRQVYRGLDIGTCKVPRDKKSRSYPLSPIPYVSKGVPHHLIDFVSPRRRYSSAEYAMAARKIISKLLITNSLPIICGGTGHYIDALLGTQTIPNVPPDPKLRARFDKLTAKQLFEMLRKLDPARAASIDRKNPRRLIRALEIVMTTGHPVPKTKTTQHSDPAVGGVRMLGKEKPVQILKIGLCPPPAKLKKRINARLEADLQHGLIAEVKKLHARGLSWKRLDELGLEYRAVAQYVRSRGRITHNQLLMTLRTELSRYAKRQLQWWKRDKEIMWVKKESEAVRATKKFLRR